MKIDGYQSINCYRLISIGIDFDPSTNSSIAYAGPGILFPKTTQTPAEDFLTQGIAERCFLSSLWIHMCALERGSAGRPRTSLHQSKYTLKWPAIFVKLTLIFLGGGERGCSVPQPFCLYCRCWSRSFFLCYCCCYSRFPKCISKAFEGYSSQFNEILHL